MSYVVHLILVSGTHTFMHTNKIIVHTILVAFRKYQYQCQVFEYSICPSFVDLTTFLENYFI